MKKNVQWVLDYWDDGVEKYQKFVTNFCFKNPGNQGIILLYIDAKIISSIEGIPTIEDLMYLL